MDAVIGALRVVLGMDSAAFEEGWSEAQRTMNRGARELARIGDQMAQIGMSLTLGLTVPLAAAAAGAVKTASDVAEMQSAFDLIFADMSKDVETWAEKTGNAIGRSTDELQKSALAFQMLFKQATPVQEKAAGLSKDFALLAQDLASFYNVAEGDALAKLRSGLTGEAEPMRDFGVFLTEAAVANKGLQMGLAGTTKELTEQDKILARAQLIWEGTKDAQGDATRTAGGFANQTRALKADIHDLAVTVGGILMPFAQKLVAHLREAANAFNDLSPGVQKFIVGALGVAVAAGPLVMALGGMARGLSAIMTFMASPAIAAALPGLVPVLGPIAAAAAAVAAVFIVTWPKVGPVLQNLWKTAQDTIGPRLVALWDNLSAKLTAFWNSEGGAVLRKVLDWLTTEFANGIKWWGEYTIGRIGNVIDFFNNMVNYFSAAVSFVSNIISGEWKKAWDDFLKIVNSGVLAVINLLGIVAPKTAAAMEGAWRGFAARIGIEQEKLNTTLSDGPAKAVAAGAPKLKAAVQTAIVDPVKEGADKAAKAIATLKTQFDSFRSGYATPDEAADMRHAKDMAELNELWRKGAIKTREEYEELKRRIDAARAAAYEITKPETYSVQPRVPDILDTSGMTQDMKDHAEQLKRTMKEAWADVGYAAKNVLLDVIEDGKVNWRSLISFIIDNWQSVSKVISDVWKQAQAGGANGGGLWGMIGGGLGAIFKGIPGFADGVNNFGGGLAWVGERGPELVNLPRGASVIPNHALGGFGGSGGMGLAISVVPSPLFDVHVARTTAPMAQQAATQGAAGGMQLAGLERAREARRTIPEY